jgi:tocopherol O-methyltransferase
MARALARKRGGQLSVLILPSRIRKPSFPFFPDIGSRARVKVRLSVIAPTTTIDPAEVAGHYDDLDLFYREIWGEHVHHGYWKTSHTPPEEAVVHLVEVIADLSGVHRGSAVVDIGCGYGATARYLALRHDARVTAVTLSERQYLYALQCGGSPTYLLGDWLQIELPAGTFDVAIAIESSEHMPDLTAFFQRAYRSLRVGGCLVVSAWLSAPDPAPWQRRYLLEPICREGRLVRLVNGEELASIARSVGFQTDGWLDASHQVARSWSVVIRRTFGGLLSDSRYRSFLLDGRERNRVFALTVARIWLAYRTRGLQYGIFKFVRAS